jgi:hypothetical protein
MILQYSEIESKRFNLRVFRGSPVNSNIDEILHIIEKEQVDVAIMRLPTKEQHMLAQLSTLPFQVIVADTVLTWSCDMRISPPSPLRSSRLVVRRATADDRPVLQEMVELVFKNHPTHYRSNLLFDSQLVQAGYEEWAFSYLYATEAEKACFLFYIDDKAVAFSTIALHEKAGEGVLFGARPDAATPGLYGDMVRHAMQYMLDHGRRWATGTTQVQNHGVLRLWVREGFLPSESHYTIHINTLRNQHN